MDTKEFAFAKCILKTLLNKDLLTSAEYNKALILIEKKNQNKATKTSSILLDISAHKSDIYDDDKGGLN